MSNIKKFILGVFAFCFMLFFVGCSDNQTPTPSLPDIPPITSDSAAISDSEAKNYLNQTIDIIYKKIDQINGLSSLTKSDFQNLSSSSLSLSGEIETILNAALIFDYERKVFDEYNLKSEILYTNKNLLNLKQFARLSVDNLKSKIVFSIIEDGLDESGEFKSFMIEAELENSGVKLIKLKSVQSDDEGKNLIIFGFEIDVKLDTMMLYFAKPSTSLDPISFVSSYLNSEDYKDVVWNTYMICKFDFSETAAIKYFSEIDAKKGNAILTPPNLFKQCVISANFLDCALNYVEFDSLFNTNKNNNANLFDKLENKYIEYNYLNNEFKVV